ncbi:MAG TPA: hypothetical protein VJ506_04280, partial [Candidatus Limnocylindrales bacterium]|nr:hypothetical protein [Candidatus Limnocylindrales bacterium]
MHRASRRSTARSAFGLVAAVVIALPAAWPATAASAAFATSDSRAGADTAAQQLAAGGATPAGSGPARDAASGTAADAPPGGPLQPSAQYLDSLAHATDHIDFQPGGRVTIPFRPRADDTWQVDGGRARPLP